MKETLVQTLTYACEQVYDQALESIDALDQALRNQPWNVFKRLRHHLYALHPNEQTLPWMRELIVDYDDYANREYHYEFQLMIRKASEHFGAHLLSQEERDRIFETILSGPSKENFREWMGAQYSEQAFQQRQRYFHRMQLRPFFALLSGDVQQYFNKVENDTQDETVTDESYFPFSGAVSGTVSYRSPKTIEELEELTDAEALAYLNNWDEGYYDKDDPLVRVNISALADVFRDLFKGDIVRDEDRLNFWFEHRENIARPVYIVAMIHAMTELVKEKDFDKLGQWIEFCEWVLRHVDTARKEGRHEPGGESRDHPDWSSSRRAVVDFIDACVKGDVNAPLAERAGIASLLQKVCVQFDWRLDSNRPVLLNRDDPVTEAINNTRSRALESLVNFGFWVRRQLPEDELPEITNILNLRVEASTAVPLSIPELALLGVHFNNLFVLTQDWALKHREVIFPQTDPAVWSKTFGSHIRFGRPYKRIYEVLKDDFVFAVNNLELLGASDQSGDHIVDRLGQFIFSLYLWGLYPKKGEGSLLQRFYDSTAGDPKLWGHLFDHVGRSFSNSGKDADKDLLDRAMEYCEWRLEVGETQELREFTFWLQAECFTPEWRLKAFSRILDLGAMRDFAFSLQIRYLKDLLEANAPLVVECFAKITDGMDQGTQLYISTDEAKPILKVGLGSDNSEVKGNAERARENLLRLGRFDYLDIS